MEQNLYDVYTFLRQMGNYDPRESLPCTTERCKHCGIWPRAPLLNVLEMFTLMDFESIEALRTEEVSLGYYAPKSTIQTGYWKLILKASLTTFTTNGS
jgi:hypothetical protein